MCTYDFICVECVCDLCCELYEFVLCVCVGGGCVYVCPYWMADHKQKQLMPDPAEVSPVWVSGFPLESVAESEEKSDWIYCLFWDEETVLGLRDPIVPVTGGARGSSQSASNRRGTRHPALLF